MVWGPWWPRHPGHSGPRLNLGFQRVFQRFNLGQIDTINDRESILAGPCPGLDQDAFLQKFADSSFDHGLSQLGVPLNRPLGTPNARTIITRLVSQKHDDLLARCVAELPFRACVCDPPAHGKARKGTKACEFCTGFVRDFRRFSRIRPESSRDFPQASAEPHANKPYFLGVFGDPDWIRTSNLPLRRKKLTVIIV